MAANSPRNSLGNVRSDMDITYPEHLSRLNRHLVVEYAKPHTKSRRQNRPRNRYRTQPVTFDEIQEVDEENSLIDDQDPNAVLLSSSLQSNFKQDFFKLLESKRKKANDAEAGTENNGLDSVNGEPPVQSKQVDQLRRTDHGREASI
ncbi:uncharacterized protein CDAR_234061 [Caerostris darwini]|uniref:Uncharacterized protein n=1 Tax=Caerostris darwini TaxID=1538125 RepID=A0AAV4UEH7_9ARAC|nr:uncharacterized protein CDAR_234061 [Caerostris darwini]